MSDALHPNPYAPPDVDPGEELGGSPSIRLGALWRRLGAAAVDVVAVAALQVVGAMLLLAFVVPLGLLVESRGIMNPGTVNWIAPLEVAAVAFLLLGAPFLYGVSMESSTIGGTMGKVALGLRVTDLHGRRISLSRAALRNVGKAVSMLTGVGLLLALVDRDNQTLHDLLAGTLVIAELPPAPGVVVEHSSKPG